jgi:hypothetical protein
VVSVGREFDGKVGPAKTMRVSAVGVFVVAEDGRPRTIPLPLIPPPGLKLPARPGDVREVNTRGPGNVPVRWKMVVRGTEKVTVPAGTFAAVRFDHTHTIPGVDGLPETVFHFSQWFAPDVGLVRETWADKEVGVLKSFTPGRPKP